MCFVDCRNLELSKLYTHFVLFELSGRYVSDNRSTANSYISGLIDGSIFTLSSLRRSNRSIINYKHQLYQLLQDNTNNTDNNNTDRSLLFVGIFRDIKKITVSV